MGISFSLKGDFIKKDEVFALQKEVERCHYALHEKTGKGNDFLGWVDLPVNYDKEEFDRIKKAAARIQANSEVLIVIGIGGSYLGARAVYEALSDPFNLLYEHPANPILLFVGQNLSEDYLARLLAAVENRSIAAIVISKSGTTTEPAIAFRLIRSEIERRYGRKEAARRIVAVTDRSRGALKTLADREGYRTFVIPDDVGGRYSVLTPVGLLPLAAAGIDIRSLLAGACEMERATADGVPFDENPAARYAAVRNILYRQGFMIEILASYEPQLQYLAEWWKQLFGESEGKQGRGIFPASVTFTADLHSMGQYIQEGERTLFETVVSVAAPARSARPSGRRSPARPRSSLHSAFPRCRMQTAFWCWRTARSTVWAPTQSCWRPMPSIRRSTTARRRAAAILTSREVRSNGSKRSTWPRPAGRTGAAPQGGKPGQAAEAHHG